MTIRDFNGKNVCVLGYGREGKAVVAVLEKHAPGCEITIADKDENIRSANPRHWLQLGTGWLHNLEKFDAVIKSPGIPPQPEFESVKQQMTSTTQIFLDSIADRGATVIGITGSKGKSTTASLIHAILTAGGKDALLLGNIGEPAIAHIDDVKQDTIVVMEMSSYQLMDLTVSPQIAVVTSFFPDHLDYHGSLEAYLDAKKHITRFQTEEDAVFFCETSRGAVEIAKEGGGRKIPFAADESPVEIEETHLLGEHNLGNIAAACKVAAEFGVPEKTAVKAVKAFRGLPHRLENLGTHHGIVWVDDAISTTPESTIAGLHALEGRVKTIILGGQDRGYAFDGLAQELGESGVEHAILFPGSGPRIREAIERAGVPVKLHDAPDMDTAVRTARAVTPEGAICLLSTASPSYGMFKNFEEKGDAFRRCVQA